MPARESVNLVVSHGCQPFETEGAWCSPGYWRNAADAAWALTGQAKTELFNDTVAPTKSSANPTLIQVLTTPGANTFGKASGPWARAQRANRMAPRTPEGPFHAQEVARPEGLGQPSTTLLPIRGARHWRGLLRARRR
jgi:hypothetical protein